MPTATNIVRIAALGDLTDYGLPEEARALARELAALKVPMVGVLGHHDYEPGQETEVRQIFAEAGVQLLDGDSTEILGIGFAGIKGFAGGFGPPSFTATPITASPKPARRATCRSTTSRSR